MSTGRRQYHPVLFYIFVIIGAFLVGVVIFHTFIMPGLVGRGDVVVVPDLEGLSVTMAREKCADSGLELIEIGRRNSAEIPEDYVLEQKPGPAESLKEGRAIKVVVSAGMMMEVVPDLRNKSLRQAELMLQSSRLRKGRVSRIFRHEKAENTVIATSPPAGAYVPRGSGVDILLPANEEPRKYIMPDLAGMDLPFVKDRLEMLGFEVARIVSLTDRDKFPNTILDQNPKAGFIIQEGGTIELVVSTVE
jgi:serine/threonine-protein kinase